MSDSIGNLKKSVVFNLMLGNKELSHSNFWAFLIGEYNDIARVFFDDIDVSGKLSVKREKNHTDILITDKYGNNYIIENKLKSLPNETQLNNYTNQIKNLKAGLLTGVIKSNLKLPDNWKYMTYKEITSKLCNYINILETTTEKVVLEEYIEILNHIEESLGNAIKQTEGVWDLSPSHELSKIRFHDLFLKYKGCELIEYIDISISSSGILELLKDGWNYNKNLSFNRGKPTITHYIYKDDLTFEVQIEEYQYRHNGKSTSKFDRDAVFKDFDEWGWFPKGYIGEGRNKEGYNSYYKNNQYSVVYKYTYLEKNTSYSVLADRVINSLKLAIDIINSK